VNDSLPSTFVAGQTPSTQSELHEQGHRHTHSDPSNQAAWRQIGQREGRLICVPSLSVHQWMALDRLGDVCSLLLSLEVRQDMGIDHSKWLYQLKHCIAQLDETKFG
jgi:hypothetical protein